MASNLTSTDRAKVLRALQLKLATSIDRAKPNEVAPLARQLMFVTAELATITKPEASSVDDLAQARNRRRTKASAAGSATRSKQRSS